MSAPIIYEYAEDGRIKGDNERALQIWIRGVSGKRLYSGLSVGLADLQIHGKKTGGDKDRAKFYETFKDACIQNWNTPVHGTFHFEFKGYDITVTRQADLI